MLLAFPLSANAGCCSSSRSSSSSYRSSSPSRSTYRSSPSSSTRTRTSSTPYQAQPNQELTDSQKRTLAQQQVIRNRNSAIQRQRTIQQNRVRAIQRQRLVAQRARLPRRPAVYRGRTIRSGVSNCSVQMWQYHNPACDAYYLSSNGVIMAHKKSHKGIWIVLGILVLLVIAGVLFFVFRKESYGS